jgi:phosphohistidine phosphatase
MRLLLVRHAEAVPGEPDALRELTPQGTEQARTLGTKLRGDGLVPDAVLTSPLIRAQQTAAALELGEPAVDERLAPGATPAGVRDAVRGRGETVLVVGHQPDCGRVAAALSTGPEPLFPPCGLAVLELADA